MEGYDRRKDGLGMADASTSPLPKCAEQCSVADVISEVRALREDVKMISERATYAADTATKAYQESQDAKRAVEEHKATVQSATDAMVRHVETIQSASDAIVKSNQEQNPTIDAILSTVKALNKNKTSILTAVAFVGLAIGTFVSSVVHAYLAAKGH